MKRLLPLLLFLIFLTVAVPAQVAGSAFGRYYALVIGNQNYEQLTVLHTPRADAEAVAEVLKKQYGFEVELLLDATWQQAMQAITGLRSTANRKEDNLLIYYAGHGYFNKKTGVEYWQPVDAERNNDIYWIPTSRITTMLKEIRAKHVLVVADSCYSGSLLTRDSGARLPDGAGWDEWLRRMLTKRSRTALTSGGKEPVLDSGGGNHSIFAKAFLDALRKNNKILDGYSLFDWVKRPIVLNATQTPRYGDIKMTGHEWGDFLLVPKKFQGIDLPEQAGEPTGRGFATRGTVAQIAEQPARRAEPAVPAVPKQVDTITDSTKMMGHERGDFLLEPEELQKIDFPEQAEEPTGRGFATRGTPTQFLGQTFKSEKSASKTDHKRGDTMTEPVIANAWQTPLYEVIKMTDHTVSEKLQGRTLIDKQESKKERNFAKRGSEDDLTSAVEENRAEQVSSQPAGKKGPVSPAAPKQDDTMTDPTTDMQFVYVPKGCFQMGQTAEEQQQILAEVGQKNYDSQYKDELPCHKTCVDGFWMGKYEVTQGQWEQIMGENPAKFKKGDNYPVEQISWDSVQKFLAELNKRSGKTYRLPREAEWEYACRANGSGKYCGGDNLDALAWYSRNSSKSIHPVGEKQANGFGLYDMSGNVWEWCEDWYGKDYYAESLRNNPIGPASGSNRVLRGGGYFDAPLKCRPVDRHHLSPVLRARRFGFRLLLPFQSAGS